MFWMFSKSFLLTILFHDYVSWGGGGTVSACQYEIQGLDDSVTVNTTMDIGATVHNLTLVPVSNMSGPYTSDAYDIILNTISPYYELIFVAGHHEVVVKSCLKDGHTGFLYFSINETLDTDGSCYESMLRIYVEPSNPFFNIPPAVNISVDTCVPPTTLDVIQLQFDNGGNCSAWNCSVNSINDAKLFWVGTGNTVQTFSNDTNFNFTYKLLVTCFDNDAPATLVDSKEIDTSGFEALDVMFVNPGLCTSTELPVTTSLLNLTQQDSRNGCLDDPANVALVASLGGVTAGAAVGAGLFILAVRYCRPKRITAVEE